MRSAKNNTTSCISVIIPMYNAELTIINTLESVRNQEFDGDIEIIIVNDGSTDNSLDVVARYMHKHRELNIRIIDKANGGVASARNAGIKAAHGEFIALLDSDDEWLVNKLKTIMPYFSNKEIDCIGSSRNGRVLKVGFKTIKKLTRIYPCDLIFRSNLATPTIMFRKAIVEKTGLFDENMRFGEDFDYWLRIAHHCRFFVIPDSLIITGGGKYDYGESGLSSNLKEMYCGMLKAISNAYVVGAISWITCKISQIFAGLKYIRRLSIVRLRQKN